MADVETLVRRQALKRLNVSDRLTLVASKMPDAVAVACPWRRSLSKSRIYQGNSGAAYATITFAEMEQFVSDVALGLKAWGVPRGTRLALLVKPGIEFVALVFGLLRAGIVIVLVDPGLGRRNLIRCLADAEPEGFVAIGRAHLARLLYRNRFPRARWNVTVGRRWFWRGKTLPELRLMGRELRPHDKSREAEFDDPDLRPAKNGDAAAIIFTSGSTGPAKGVLYTQQMFETQVDEIQRTYAIEPGGVDLACFPLFALFNAAMGITTVLPEIDFSRPARVDPAKLLRAANDWNVTQSFASPAVWKVLSEHCSQTGEKIPTLKKLFSCGAPVPGSLISRTLECVANHAEMYTPYGATECLPISTIDASEIITETASSTDAGSGVCVGRKFESAEWRVIQISDHPIANLDDAHEMPTGQIGELVVRGPQVSPDYAIPASANIDSKIASALESWHRTGDVGYVDLKDRFWYCGRLSQRVVTREGTLFTECIEATFNTQPAVKRCALVGVGTRGSQTPVLIVERGQDWTDADDAELRRRAAANGQVPRIKYFIIVRWPLPVDVRHNAKVNREKLAVWATKRLRKTIQQRQLPKS